MIFMISSPSHTITSALLYSLEREQLSPAHTHGREVRFYLLKEVSMPLGDLDVAFWSLGLALVDSSNNSFILI